MIEETISRIEQRLRDSENLSPENRLELEAMLGELRRETAQLRQSPGLPATIEEHHSLVDDLNASVAGLEQSHPTIVEMVNRISTMLANLGI